VNGFLIAGRQAQRRYKRLPALLSSRLGSYQSRLQSKASQPDFFKRTSSRIESHNISRIVSVRRVTTLQTEKLCRTKKRVRF